MRLIELLVQKTLNGKFTWPSNASQIFQDYDGELRPDANFVDLYLEQVAENHRMCGVPFGELGESYIVTREQYEAALAAAQHPVWDGEGLPPVGCECERSWAGDKWLNCRVLFVSDEHVVVKLATHESVYRHNEVKFRHIRSEADKKRDAAINKIKQVLMYDYGDDPRMNDATFLYDAIAAGEIPGVKLSD